MAYHRAFAVLACFAVGCGAAAAQKPLAPAAEPATAPPSSSNTTEPSQVSKWSEVPQNEPANQRSVIGRRKAQVTIVSDPSSHGEALHFKFVVNSVTISGVFSAPGGQTSTFTLPTGSVQFTIDECKDEPQYFELAADTPATLKCEMTTEGDCCYVPDDEQKH
jgi:hypothetical protein